MIRGEGTAFTQALFKDIDKDDLQTARKVMQKPCMLHINEMDNKLEIIK